MKSWAPIDNICHTILGPYHIGLNLHNLKLSWFQSLTRTKSLSGTTRGQTLWAISVTIVAPWWCPSRHGKGMRYSSLLWIGVENSLENYKKQIFDSIWLRPNISLDDPKNNPYPKTRLFMSTSTCSISWINDDRWCICSSHGLLNMAWLLR